MNFKPLSSLFVLLFAFSLMGNSQSLLQTNGTAIVNESGDTIILRGMGLGGWMVQEGYMLQTSGFADPQWEIRQTIEDLIGPDNTDMFYDAWLANHVRKADIDSLKTWGFNSVRLPMHYNLYTLSIQDEPVEGENTWLDKGFELTDSLISWCKQNEMYVVLDLHAAPGGQGYEQSISDYNPAFPSLWESVPNRNKTAALWRRIADRYKNEKWVAGYDLINEVNWDLGGANTVLRNVYKQITDSIRSVDQEHMIIVEGNWFANDFNGLTPPWDDNMVYSPHKYWSVNDQASIQWVLDLQAQHNVPLYLGESGENSNVWFRDAIRLVEDRGIGWAWWPMKKIESISCPTSIVKNDGYQTLLDYWSGGGTAPTVDDATDALMQLTENLKVENCRFQKDVIDAMFRQVYSDETLPYTTQEIPGVVYSTDFDLGVVGSAYFDTDLATYHVTTGNFTSWNNGWAYRNDGVDIEVTEDMTNTNGYSLGWLTTNEWMKYSVDVANTAVYDVHVRIATEASGGQLHFEVGGAPVSTSVTVPNTGGWQTWQTLTIEDVILDENDKKLTCYIDEGTFNMGSFEFVETGLTTDLETKFQSAITEDESTVQLNINKPLTGPLPVNPADFFIFVDGGTVPVTATELDADNARIIHFTVNYTFSADEVITISYIGDEIFAQDGTILSEFITQPVENTIIQLHQIPGKIEAEDYSFQLGVELETTTDVGGGENIGFLDVGDYLDYFVNVNQTGLYNVTYRTAAESEVGQVQMQLIDENGFATPMQTVSFPATGGWQTWGSTSMEVPFFSTGQKQIRIVITQPLFNLNWFEFDFLTSTEEVEVGSNLKVSPNPNSGQFFLRGNFEGVGEISLEVYDMLGQKIQSRQVANGLAMNELIDISENSEGCYFVVVRTDAETFVEKVMVNK